MRKLVLLLFLLSTITTMAQLTTDEKKIINDGSITEPFSVLLTTNQQDSLFLRKPSVDVDLSMDMDDINTLIQRMKVTMEAESGVGLAAPQIGITRNIFLFTRITNPNYPVIVAINPKIVNYPTETICFERDGCLSIPNISGNSVRYPWVEVEYQNQDGSVVREKLEGYSRKDDFTGIIFQHEYDHLQGVLFIDKLCE